MNNKVCIYHGTCFDGFGAAWVVREYHRANGHVLPTFHAGVYGQEPPPTEGAHVILVDFSYKRPVMERIIAGALSVTILDHHKTAQADLAGLEAENVDVVFDMERSGAGIAWDYFFASCKRLALIDYIEDRDLWRFALPKSREVHAGLSSYPYDFEVWDDLMRRPIEQLVNEGEVIERKHFQDIRSLLPVVKRRMTIGGISVPVANMPITMTSDAGNILAIGEPFAACYWDTESGRVFSLRSSNGGVDVSEIAARYGGGGHKRAAGFTAPTGWEGE